MPALRLASAITAARAAGVREDKLVEAHDFSSAPGSPALSKPLFLDFHFLNTELAAFTASGFAATALAADTLPPPEPLPPMLRLPHLVLV